MSGNIGAIASAMMAEGENLAAKDLSSQLKSGDINNLRMSAEIFLAKYKATVEKVNKEIHKEYWKERSKGLFRTAKDFKKSQHYENFQKARTKAIEDMNIQQIYEFFDIALSFEKEIQKFLGNTISTIFVYTGPAGTVEIYSIKGSAKEIFDIGYSSSNKVVARYKRSLAQIGTPLTIEDYDPKGLNITYSEVLRRGRISKEKLGLKSKMKIFYQNESGVWELMQVASEGDLGEAYAGFYLSKDEFFNKHALLENIRYFLFGHPEYSVDKVDSASGLLKGDIRLKNGEQYAIKSIGATMTGYDQMVRIAEKIKDGKIVDVQTLKSHLFKGKTRNAKLTGSIQQDLEKLLEGFVSE